MVYLTVLRIRIRIRIHMFFGLLDPDLDPLIRSGSFYHQAKLIRKTLNPTALWLLFDFLSLKMIYSKCTSKKIYRLKEDQAFSLSLELGQREKVVRHPSVDFLLHSIGGGWWFCRYCYCSENALEGMRDIWFWFWYWKINSCLFLFKNPFILLFKGIVSRDSI
jgi:hypothetical protein